MMIDHNYWSLKPYLNSIGRNIEAVTTGEQGFIGEAKDADLVGATANGLVLVTSDKRTITRKLIPPCTHGGIILFKSRRLPEEEARAIMKAFCLSGDRKYAIGHVTYLYEDHAEIYTHKEKITLGWGSAKHRKQRWRRVEPLP
jgi:hypothetical protein